MEYCQAGSVSDVMRLCRSTLSDEQIAYVMKDSLKGLMYIHSKRKIHRDIKGGNILLTSTGEAKIGETFFFFCFFFPHPLTLVAYLPCKQKQLILESLVR